MLIAMLTAMYIMVRVVEQIGARWVRQPDPQPYIVSQPLPWQIHYVSHSRRGSRAEEYDGQRRNSLGVYRKNSTNSNGQCHAANPVSDADRAAAKIQSEFGKYQQKKQKESK